MTRPGMVHLNVEVHRGWLAEALAKRGYGHADNDSTDELARKLKLFLEDIAVEAMCEETGEGSPPARWGKTLSTGDAPGEWRRRC